MTQQSSNTQGEPEFTKEEVVEALIELMKQDRVVAIWEEDLKDYVFILAEIYEPAMGMTAPSQAVKQFYDKVIEQSWWCGL
jgi:hypothetical protein